MDWGIVVVLVDNACGVSFASWRLCPSSWWCIISILLSRPHVGTTGWILDIITYLQPISSTFCSCPGIFGLSRVRSDLESSSSICSHDSNVRFQENWWMNSILQWVYPTDRWIANTRYHAQTNEHRRWTCPRTPQVCTVDQCICYNITRLLWNIKARRQSWYGSSPVHVVDCFSWDWITSSAVGNGRSHLFRHHVLFSAPSRMESWKCQSDVKMKKVLDKRMNPSGIWMVDSSRSSFQVRRHGPFQRCQRARMQTNESHRAEDGGCCHEWWRQTYDHRHQEQEQEWNIYLYLWSICGHQGRIKIEPSISSKPS